MTRYVAADRKLDADPVRLTQVFWNLLNNALKFSEDGKTVHLMVRRETDDVVAVSIQDEGSGMPTELLPHVFEPFVQAGRPGESSGLGIGLTLVKRFVELHGGSVEASSDGPGKGSTFTVRLTVAESRYEQRYTQCYVELVSGRRMPHLPGRAAYTTTWEIAIERPNMPRVSVLKFPLG